MNKTVERFRLPQDLAPGLSPLVAMFALIPFFPLSTRAAPTRMANTSLNLPAELPSGSYSTTNAFPGLSFTDPVVIVTPPGETNRLFIIEKPGRIAVIPDLSDPTREVFLDIVPRVRSTGNEEGLLGLAFHPNYNNIGETGYGEFFVYYQTDVSSQRHWRLSLFSVSNGNPNRGNADSEIPMITQRDEAGNHNGGDLHFGNDGYLYVSLGDEGGGGDPYDNGQRIDKDFFSAILRIDVDRKEENLVPNAHPSIHNNTYRVPADNPFIGATTFNGASVVPASVRTEFWAIGLRNPWRMSFDRPTDRLFVADVGQIEREEINILSESVFAENNGVPNYGWSFREGFQAYTTGPGGATPPAGFSAIEPIHDYPRSQGRSVTGGLVYRGSQYPDLFGDYLFADYVTGRIWTMDDPGGISQSVTEIAVDNGISAFGLHPLTGEILLADLGSDTVKRLVQAPGPGPQPPQFLSQTGAFSNLADLTPEAGILPYEINLPFWSDHAEKTRWFSIPAVNDDMTWAENANWTFPEGQVWIKHFELELNRDNPGTNRRRIETRFLVKTEDDVYGLTYRWNAAQTDAELVDAGGATETFTVTEGGETRDQTWIFPGRADCRTCHAPAAGGALSFHTRQLNRSFDYGSGPENQLDALESAGYFSNPVPSPAGLPVFSAPDDESFTLEHRARSFLSTNCVSCHQPGGSALGSWSARPELTLQESGLLDSLLNNNAGDPFARTIVPGDPARSMIVQRMHAVANPGALPPMPPIGSTEINQEGIDLLTAWIEEIPKVLFVRGADRSGGFFEGSDDASRTEHLGDINNLTSDSRNHGWGELAATLRDEGFQVEQITETAENTSGPSEGVHIGFENLNLDQYRVIVFGSNNAVYDTAAIDAIDDYIRNGGSALFISDANFGGDWADASNSDQQFLDRFGLIMNQDQGTYQKTRSSSEFLVADHPVFENVNTFDGEGVTPITVGTLPPDVTATILAQAEGQVRRNTPPFGGSNQGPSSATTANDAALVVATAGQGRIAGHFDRNTFFNRGGVGSDITRFDNRQYAINLFRWLADASPGPDPAIIPTGLSATDGNFTDRIDLTWNAVSGASSYSVYRSTTNSFVTASPLGTPSASQYSDSTATPGVVYYYWVTATVGADQSAPGSPDAGRRGIETPSGLSASDGTSNTEITLSWNSVSGATGYRVLRSTGNNSGTATLQAVTSLPSYTDSANLTPARIYYYWVQAVVGSAQGPAGPGDSGFSTISPVSEFTATQGTDPDGVSLNWQTRPGVTAYRIYRSETDSFAGAELLATTAAFSFLDEAAIPDVTYHYFIEAINEYGAGPVSASVSGSRLFEWIQPDLRIGKSPRRMIGNDRYQSLAGQKLRVIERRRKSLRAFFRIENDGTTPDSIRLAASRSTRASLRYIRLSPSRANITSRALIGAYVSDELGQSADELMQIRMRTKQDRSRSNTVRSLIRVFSTNDNTKRDRARLDATFRN